jgi:hypothetical protein
MDTDAIRVATSLQAMGETVHVDAQQVCMLATTTITEHLVCTARVLRANKACDFRREQEEEHAYHVPHGAVITSLVVRYAGAATDVFVVLRSAELGPVSTFGALVHGTTADAVRVCLCEDLYMALLYTGIDRTSELGDVVTADVTYTVRR